VRRITGLVGRWHLSWRSLALPALGSLVVALVSVFFVVLADLSPVHPGAQVRQDQLAALIRTHAVRSAVFEDEDAVVVLTLRSGATAWAAYPKSDTVTGELLDRLDTAGSAVRIDHQSGKASERFLAQFLLPLLILAALFASLFVLIRGRGGSEFSLFSQIAARRRSKRDTGRVTFADVGAAAEAITELAEIRDYLHDPTAYEAFGALAPKGVLLVGPPGTGKTLLAKAVAGEANVPFFSISGSEFVESLVGVGAARVRSLFRQVRAAAPAIVFIDELDAAGRQRGAGVGQGNDEREQTLNQLLVEMDGFEASAGVVVMAATNRPDILDPALLRPGRFDRQITIDVPDVFGRAEILRLYTRGRPVDPAVSLEAVARSCPGFSGAELAGLVNESALLALRAGKSVIGQTELSEAIDRVLAGPARRAYVLSDEDKRLLAYHEGGHAVVARALGLGAEIQKVSIVARGRNLGHTTIYPGADRVVRTRQDLYDELVATMGGVAAEILVLGQGSTGDETDLRRATDLAREMVCSYGMSEQVGRIAVGSKAGEVFLGRDFTSLGNLSEALLERVDNETTRLVSDAEAAAETLLLTHRDSLDALAAQLVQDETLSGEQLEDLLRPLDHRNGRAAPRRRRRREASVG
jgi:cell division protease FtsH